MKLVNSCFILLFFLPLFLFSYTNYVDFAEKLFEDGFFSEAIHEYKRILFFETDEVEKAKIYFRLGIISRENGEYKNSIDYFNMFIRDAKTENEKQNALIEIGITYLYQTNFNNAIYQFMKVESFSEDDSLRKKALFYLTLSYVLSYRWENARESFESFLALIEDSKKREMENEIEEVKNALKEVKNFKYKSPELAKWLSVFIFGAGQIYAGEIAGGLNAFALNGLIFYLVIDFFLKADYLDAIFIAVSFLDRYYSGNIYRAEEAAKIYNEKNNERFSKAILKRLDRVVFER
ncbi:MAG: tetratricopeptide repeat protein [Brevinematia bacterium]